MLCEHDVQIAPSTYHARQAQPVSDAELEDAWMANTLLDLWRANRSLYGADKLAVAARKKGHDIGRDQVARLMKIVGITGNIRGKHRTWTTRSDPSGGRIVYQATLRLDGGPRVHPVSPWIAAGLLCVSFRDTSPKLREVALDGRYALHTAQPWDDHAGQFGEFMATGRLEPIAASHPAVTGRPTG